MSTKVKLYFFICLVLYSCNQGDLYKNKYTLKASEDHIRIEIDSNSTNLSFCLQYLISNNTNYLAVLAQKFNSLIIYDLDRREIYKKFEFNSTGPNALLNPYGFVMKSLDTTLVVGFSPKVIYILNSNGDIIKKISYDKDSNGKPINPSWANLGYRPFIKDSILYLFPAISSDDPTGILTSVKHQYSPVDIAINLNTGKIKIPLLKIPEELVGKDVRGINVCRTINKTNCFVYIFSILEGLFITCDFQNFIKVKIETNYRFALKENQSKNVSDMGKALRYNLSHDEIIDILYDTFRECYYLVVFKRTDNFDKNPDFRSEFLYPEGFIIILDKDFKHMGEVNLPENLYSLKMMFITAEGLYISEDHINNPLYSEDYMQFRLFNLVKL